MQGRGFEFRTPLNKKIQSFVQTTLAFFLKTLF